jgi:PEP-CTERM motif-containing protein
VLVKFSKLFVLLALVVLAVSVAKADTIDPTVIIRQVDPVPVPITDPNGTIPLSFSATANVFAFQNDTGTLLYSLSLTLFGFPQGLDFNFGTNPGDGIFSSFAKTVNQDGSQSLLFFGIDDSHTGLLPSTGCNLESDGDADDFCGPVYTIEIDGIPANDFVFGTATVSTPEPATLLLLSTGLVGLAAFRRRRSSPQA